MTAGLQDRALEKRQKILDAARDVILRSGLRAATMEEIARQAGIAKPTLYAQFANKDQVFEALMDALVASMSSAFDAAFAGNAPLPERIGKGLAEKYGTAADLLDGSAHAQELVGAHNRLYRRIERADTAIAERIVVALRAEGYDAPEDLTAVLVAACSGILENFSGGDAVRAAILLLCEKALRR